MFIDDELIEILVINVILWLIMLLGRPVVITVKKLPRIGSLSPLGINYLIFVFITKSEFDNEKSREAILQHEFSHYRQFIRYSPFLLVIIHFTNLFYLLFRYQSVRQIYNHLWIERNANKNIRKTEMKYFLIDRKSL